MPTQSEIDAAFQVLYRIPARDVRMSRMFDTLDTLKGDLVRAGLYVDPDADTSSKSL